MNQKGTAQNIRIISKYASSREYGFETRLFALAREFKKMGRNPVIISSDSNHFGTFPRFSSRYNHEIIDGIEVCWIRTLKYKKTISVRRVLSWIDFELKLMMMKRKEFPQPDIIIVSSLSLLTILNGIRLKRKTGCKLIFEIRDIWPLTLTEEGGYSESNPFVKLLARIEKRGYRKADLVIGTMPNLAAHVAEVAGEGIKCTCVPFGFDPKFYDDSAVTAPTIRHPMIPEGKFVIGYAGSIGVTNALDPLIQCIRELSENHKLFFVILGDGGLRERYMQETAGLNNIAFIPKVERAKVRLILQQCDLLYFSVYNSKVWEYGMSLNKLIDYMMSAKPILASYSGFPSMLNESGCGKFVPAGDPASLKEAITEFSERPVDQLEEMGLLGRKWLLENRRWDVLAAQYLKICDQVCSNHFVEK